MNPGIVINIRINMNTGLNAKPITITGSNLPPLISDFRLCQGDLPPHSYCSSRIQLSYVKLLSFCSA
jgi:hypothetical protein